MTYRILTLDGGGTWALLEAMALKDIYGDLPGLEILSHFDLAAANSGGTIVLGGLVANWRPSEIIAKLKDPATRKSIFAKKSIFGRATTFGLGYKYDTDKKLVGLTAVLGADAHIRVRDLPQKFAGMARKPNFIFCAYNYDTTREEFFRSQTGSGASSGGASANDDVTLVQAIHTSTNAPVMFFDSPATIGRRRYWDGGVGGYNNPVLAAVIEALRNGAVAADIRILCLGTGTIRRPIATGATGEDPDFFQEQKDYNLIRDIKKLATAIVDDPPDAATFHVHVMLGSADATPALVRLSPIVRPILKNNTWSFPQGLTRNEFVRLCDLDMDATDQKDVELIDYLGTQWIKGLVPNQPIQIKGDTLEASIPYQNYATAKAAWLAFP